MIKKIVPNVTTVDFGYDDLNRAYAIARTPTRECNESRHLYTGDCCMHGSRCPCHVYEPRKLFRDHSWHVFSWLEHIYAKQQDSERVEHMAEAGYDGPEEDCDRDAVDEHFEDFGRDDWKLGE